MINQGGDPVRRAREHKILSHKVFPDVIYSIWMDGSIEIREGVDLGMLVESHLKSCDIALFPHRTRACAYVEAEVCSKLELDDPQVISQQMLRYRQMGYPEGMGLGETGVILRRHTEVVRELNELWWSEICSGSRRDQLSFNYVLWRLGVEYMKLPGDFSNNPFFTVRSHNERRLRFHEG
jgi:hypothetical protein